MTAPSSLPASPPPDTRDRLPLWVVVLLFAFFALRLVNLHGDLAASRNSHVASLIGQVDEKTMGDTVSTNWQAKSAYLSSLGKSDSAMPDAAGLRSALKSAESLQTESQNAPGAARRVLILRGLLHLPLPGPGKNGLDPAKAFLPAALTGLQAPEIKRYEAEGHLWADVARGPHLSPAQTAADAALLRATPNIRWWQYPALSVLYQSQGNVHLARHFSETARTQALLTLGPLTVIGLLDFLLGLAGVGLLLALVIRRISGSDAESVASSGTTSFWPVVRETIPLSERRLRAGDLMGVFVLYLLMPDILGWLVGGVGIHHWFYYAGLLKPYRGHLTALPASGRVAAEVVVSFIAYIVCAAIPIGVLVGIASRKRASISEELGFNTHRLGWNLLYGVGGYAIALPLLFLGQSVGAHIPGPTPSNPAIPMLADAGTPWVQVMLVGLATLAAPLCEELLFRGVFYNAAKLKVGVWPAIILTGLIFGFVHPVGISEMVPLAVLGGVFAWMAETRKSLVPSMLGHFMQNSMATAMLLLALGG
ncbi:MAG: CPBP family intramembrane glutamic endopeptidase [Janthinobacterium lividum]